MGCTPFIPHPSAFILYPMHRFFVLPFADDQVVFSPEQAHQITAVLRMKSGATLIVLDNTGWEYVAELVVVDRKRATAVVRQKRPSTNEPALQITLYQSGLKRDNFEWVLQKGTELGVSRFVPLITERTVARLPKKFGRWQRILTEAAEQSRRGRIPDLAGSVTFADAVSQLPDGETAVIPWVGADKGGLGDVLMGDVTAVALFIGPEGGFTPEEIALAQQRGVQPVTLGKRTLRSETAALAATAVIMHQLGDLKA